MTIGSTAFPVAGASSPLSTVRFLWRELPTPIDAWNLRECGENHPDDELRCGDRLSDALRRMAETCRVSATYRCRLGVAAWPKSVSASDKQTAGHRQFGYSTAPSIHSERPARTSTEQPVIPKGMPSGFDVMKFMNYHDLMTSVKRPSRKSPKRHTSSALPAAAPSPRDTRSGTRLTRQADLAASPAANKGQPQFEEENSPFEATSSKPYPTYNQPPRATILHAHEPFASTAPLANSEREFDELLGKMVRILANTGRLNAAAVRAVADPPLPPGYREERRAATQPLCRLASHPIWLTRWIPPENAGGSQPSGSGRVRPICH